MSDLRIRTTCPYCGLKERRAVVPFRFLKDGNYVTTNSSSATALAGAIFCDECRRPYSVVIKQGSNAVIQGILQTAGNDIATEAAVKDAPIRTFPGSLSYPVNQSLPKAIRQPFADIQQDADARRNAPGVMATARACLDVALKELGETDGGRVQRIQNLQAKGVLTSSLSEWANKLWSDGNDAVHDLSATMDNAIEHVEFLKLFFEVVFVLPSKIAQASSPTPEPPA